ncbi:hypothetical protein [Plebeiibacterium sediminum]|uniref:Uncharacterized protein n=1 Tax=Plebeiibacterium sediminum TaxID=2992112 RepID=A0AAE3M6U8_9BACT|nr:hypothetical protein [Plebeiobacterium sediminum]MCW3788122.1 hypothetical protein [Plebeiobacterium sediminum]
MLSNHWSYQFLNHTTFILGNGKNAGKTTFMNLALSYIRKEVTPTFLSVGIDGEIRDLIDGRSKPQISTFPHDIVVTSLAMIKKSDGQFKLLKAFPFYTTLGQIVIAQNLRSGKIELVGPENNNQLTCIINYLRNELNCKTIVIDGAANRKTPLSSFKNAGFFYVISINKRTLAKALETCKLLALSSSLKSNSNYDTIARTYQLKGALTSSKITEIPEDIACLEVDNFTSIFLNYKQIIQLQKQVIIRVQTIYNLNGFVVILKEIESTEFIERYNQEHINAELIINPYAC